MIKTMRSRGYFVLCYNESDYDNRNGETKKIGPFKSIENCWHRKQEEERTGNWKYVEMVERVIFTE